MKISISDFITKQKSRERIVMLTCYDYPSACILDAQGVDIALVGDSVGTTILGYADTTAVTMDDMLHHLRAVVRGIKRCFVLCDMPINTYNTPQQAIDNARVLIEAGADAVKIENAPEAIAAIATAGIPVCGHIGYTPQTDKNNAVVKGKDFQHACALVNLALKIESAGAFMIVFELIPRELAALITAHLTIPTIGIGAGETCDGQVQVINDIIGMSDRKFKHTKLFAHSREAIATAVSAYSAEVRAGSFPAVENSSSLNPDVQTELVQWLKTLKINGIKTDEL